MGCALWLRFPEFAVTVIRYVPGGVAGEAEVEKLTFVLEAFDPGTCTELGETMQMGAGVTIGVTEQVRLIVPLKPPLTVTLNEALAKKGLMGTGHLL